MGDVTFARAAVADLVSITDVLAARAGLAVAERYERRFTDAFDLFERHPGIGAPRPEIGVETRIWTVPPYVISVTRSVPMFWYFGFSMAAGISLQICCVRSGQIMSSLGRRRFPSML